MKRDYRFENYHRLRRLLPLFSEEDREEIVNPAAFEALQHCTPKQKKAIELRLEIIDGKKIGSGLHFVFFQIYFLIMIPKMPTLKKIPVQCSVLNSL